MSFCQTLIIALIPTLGISLTLIGATRDLRLRRRLECTDKFLNIASIAHARPMDGRERVGIAEQCAALALLAEFGRDEKHLREPAREALQRTQHWALGGNPIVRAAADKALSRLGNSKP